MATAATSTKRTFRVALYPLGNLAYRMGFVEAADRVLGTMIEQPIKPALLYPVCYLYRHAVELELKELIRDVQRAIRLMDEAGRAEPKAKERAAKLLEQSEALMSKHDLLQLFNNAVAWLRLSKYAELPPIVRATITTLHKVDPKGEAFRYGRFKDGKPTLGPQAWRVDLIELQADVHEALRHLNTAGNFAVITGDQILEFRADLEGE